MYQIKSSWWLRKFYPGKLIWRIPEGEKPTVYLSFDDGPHPEITPWVLQHLHQFNARASFFCIGKNVAAYPEVYQSILDAGHITGNHTYNHLNGWEVGTEEYLDNIRQTSELIEN